MKARPPEVRVREHNARSLALHVLMDCRRRDAFVQEVLDRHLAEHPLSGPDRGLATQLAYGVLRRRGTLQALVQPLVERPAHKVETWLWDALHLGAYQLALLTHVPAHAAIHETVELAKAVGRPGAKGFLNAILRKVASLVTDERTDAPAADALPLERGTYRKLTARAFPGPVQQPLEYLSAAFGLPAWLCRRWLDRWGAAECHRLGFWFAGPAPLTLRVNPLRTSRDALLAALAGASIGAEPGEQPMSVRLCDHVPIRDLLGYRQGWFSVQDESAMRAAAAVGAQPNETILDLCAAPGGKATYFAEVMGDRGRVLACDADEQRLATVGELARRLGLTGVELFGTKKHQPAPPGPFDRALVDVPCSNTGVLGKRPEARWRLRPNDLAHLAPLQADLLRQAIVRVRPGGVIVYSTCSIEPEENQQVVEAVLKEVPGLRLEAHEESSPGRPADGGYWAKLRRE